MALVKPRDVVTEVPKESAALKDQSSEEQLKESNKDAHEEYKQSLADKMKEKYPENIKCDDWFRISFFGHDYHWTEMIIILIFLVIGALGVLHNQNLIVVEAFVFWIICAAASLLGNIFLWNIGWIKSDAAYALQLKWECEDLLDEGEDMKEIVNRMRGEQAEQRKLMDDAAATTAAMAKEVGVLNEDGSVIEENLKMFENLLDSPLAIYYKLRQDRIVDYLKMANLTERRDLAYKDIINSFNVISNDGANNINLKNKRNSKRLSKPLSKYNKQALKLKSIPIDVEHLEKLDEDGDNKISAIELSEHIFSAVLRMKIGAEIVGLEKIKNEVKRIKNRIDNVKKVLKKEITFENMPVREDLDISLTVIDLLPDYEEKEGDSKENIVQNEVQLPKVKTNEEKLVEIEKEIVDARVEAKEAAISADKDKMRETRDRVKSLKKKRNNLEKLIENKKWKGKDNTAKIAELEKKIAMAQIRAAKADEEDDSDAEEAAYKEMEKIADEINVLKECG